MPDQVNVTEKGGTMRLGSYPCRLTANSRALAAYGREDIAFQLRVELDAHEPGMIRKLHGLHQPPVGTREHTPASWTPTPPIRSST